jgi:hypothetical protein
MSFTGSVPPTPIQEMLTGNATANQGDKRWGNRLQFTEDLGDAAGWVMQVGGLLSDDCLHDRWIEMVQVREENVWVLNIDAERTDRRRGKVTDIVCHNHVRVADKGGCDDMPVTFIGRRHRLDKMPVSCDLRLGERGTHVLNAARGPLGTNVRPSGERVLDFPQNMVLPGKPG